MNWKIVPFLFSFMIFLRKRKAPSQKCDGPELWAMWARQCLRPGCCLIQPPRPPGRQSAGCSKSWKRAPKPPLSLAVSCVPHAEQPNHHRLRTELEYKCAVYQNKTGSERTRLLCLTAASLPPRSAVKHRCELCPENIKVMDIELRLIFTNRRGRGETKGGRVRRLKIHYMRRERGAQMERMHEERQKQKGAERYKENNPRRKTSFTPISIFFSSANFVVVSRWVWKSVELFHREG